MLCVFMHSMFNLWREKSYPKSNKMCEHACTRSNSGFSCETVYPKERMHVLTISIFCTKMPQTFVCIGHADEINAITIEIVSKYVQNAT